ncbi:MAG: hypothetical protein AB1656_02445 [Candidatus Omnitrophota bacterium]
METLSNASIHTIGPELIFGTLFDRIGFQQIPDELFRHLVLARLAYPASKLKTVDYLRRYSGMNCSVSALYKFLDRLHSRYKSQAENDLRKMGFSKDGKFEHPQILLGTSRLTRKKSLLLNMDQDQKTLFKAIHEI